MQNLLIDHSVWVEVHCDNYHSGYWVPMLETNQSLAGYHTLANDLTEWGGMRHFETVTFGWV